MSSTLKSHSGWCTPEIAAEAERQELKANLERANLECGEAEAQLSSRVVA